MRKICDFVIKYSIYGLIFLMPLFWLPWSSEGYEFNKQYLLVFLVGLALLGWLVKMAAIKKKVFFRRTPLDLWILALAIIMILSAVFSIDSIASWMGHYGRFSGGMVGFLSVLVLYFILINNAGVGRAAKSSKEKTDSGIDENPMNFFTRQEKNGKSVKEAFLIRLGSVFWLLTISSALVVVISLLSYYGILAKIAWLPAELKNSFFSPVSASVQGLAIYLAVLVSFLAGDLLAIYGRQVKKNKLFKRSGNKAGPSKIGAWFKSFLLITSVYLLIILGFWSAWLVLGIAMAVLIVMAFWTRLFKQRVNLLMLPIVLLLIASFFVFSFPGEKAIFQGLSWIQRDLPQELRLGHDLTRHVSWQAVKEYPVFGSGPATYWHNFTKFKPLEFNQGQFWNVRFDRGGNHIMEFAANLGVLGLLAYLLVIFIFLLIISLSLQRLRRVSMAGSGEEKQKLDKAVLVVPLFLGWVALAAGQFLYSQNTVLLFLFWLFTALGIVAWQQMEKKAVKKIGFSFKKMPEVGLVVNVGLLILVFVLVGLFYLSSQFYAAEVKFSQPVQGSQAWVKKMEQVVNLNPYREIYRRGLSQAYLSVAWEEVNKAEKERDVQLLRNLASGAIQQARLAAQLAPNSVLAWQNLGQIYRDSRGLVDGVVSFSLEAYAKASKLEPNNPIFYRERCRLRLLDEERDWDNTVQLCQKAVELKENYLDAQIQLALVFEQKGELENAIQSMEGVLNRLGGVNFQRGSELANAATEIYFQLGRLYFNVEDYKKAIKMFEQSVIISPNYANARYSLGLAYQRLGRNEDALLQYRLVSQLLPNNQEIKQLIQQLEGVPEQGAEEEQSVEGEQGVEGQEQQVETEE